jgi:Methyltransferase domain
VADAKPLMSSTGRVNCRVCGGATRIAFSHTILRKYSCDYYHCETCGFLQTQEPYWLDEAYSSAIAAADTGLVRRNMAISKTLSTLLFFLFDRQGKYLDVAGGYGMLARLMRDVGFDFYWSDKYCENLLARGFEEDASAVSSYTAVTAFEVLEHVPDPLRFVTECMERANTRTMVFSTSLFEGAPPEPESWWYYAFETGQHVSFFQARTLRTIADKLAVNLCTSGAFHVLTDKTIDPRIYRVLSHPGARFLSVAPRCLMASRTMTDHDAIIRRRQ